MRNEITIFTFNGTSKIHSIDGLDFTYGINNRNIFYIYTSITFSISDVAKTISSLRKVKCTYTGPNTNLSFISTTNILVLPTDVYFEGRVYRYLDSLTTYESTKMREEARTKGKALDSYGKLVISQLSLQTMRTLCCLSNYK